MDSSWGNDLACMQNGQVEIHRSEECLEGKVRHYTLHLNIEIVHYLRMHQLLMDLLMK